MQNDTSYQGGGTVGGKVGCALATVVGLPLLSAAFIYASIGDCAPGAACVDGWKMIVAAAAISGIVGVAARAAINALLRFLRRDR
ncbi:hypothetical protein [Sphingomonas sp. BK069]|uniref:hypothetical protein n=1 Tax=Sphingomonas sp. BK069 TaxID=2586979 RepID=UPI0016099F5C|nr:hypothetical protein [Sphingomonas sp. BK069]MBB3349267.1 hypothetical protein [Sphingomonas sp. BK069]